MCGIALAACSPDASTPATESNPALTNATPAANAPAATVGQSRIATFIGRVNLQDGTFTIEAAPADANGDQVAQALTSITAGTTLGGTNTVTLSSTNLQNNCTVGGLFYSGSRCADVRITSQFAGTLRNVYFQIDSITPTSAAARNSDPAVLTLNNTLGLWGFGAIAGGATSSPRTWVFDTRSGVTSFSFRGTVWADPPCTSDGTRTNCGGTATCTDLSSDTSNCGFCGVSCGGSRACVSGVCSCPTGQTSCSSGCTNTNTDVNNCGGCGIVCGGSGATCTNGQCGCSGRGNYFCLSNTGVGGTCVSDCGSCATGTNACSANNTCLGTCGTCSSGNARCPAGTGSDCIADCSLCRGNLRTCTIGGVQSCLTSCSQCTMMGGTTCM